MKLWWVAVAEKAPGQRKERVHSFAVLAETEADACARARKESRVDLEPGLQVTVTAEISEDGIITCGFMLR